MPPAEPTTAGLRVCGQGALETSHNEHQHMTTNEFKVLGYPLLFLLLRLIVICRRYLRPSVPWDLADGH